MSNYSKIEKITIENFQSIENAVIEPDSSGITVFKGFGSSGKSAILTAIMVVMTDYLRNNQKKFIMQGKDYFRITVTFSDGVKLRRDKYKNGESLYEMYKDNQLVYSNLSGNKLIALKGMPTEIREYLQIPMLGDRYLNYQYTKQDLLLVDTTPAENYKMLGEASDEGVILKSILTLKEEARRKQEDLVEVETDLKVTRGCLKTVGDVTEDLLPLLDKRQEHAEEIDRQLRLLNEIKTKVGGVKKVILPEIDRMTEDRELELLGSMVQNFKKLNAPRLPEMEPITGYADLEILQEMRDKLENLQVKRYPEIKGFDVEELLLLKEIQKAIDGVYFGKDRVEKLEKQKETLIFERNAKIDLLQVNGYRLTKCPNCGEYHIVDNEEDLHV